MIFTRIGFQILLLALMPMLDFKEHKYVSLLFVALLFLCGAFDETIFMVVEFFGGFYAATD